MAMSFKMNPIASSACMLGAIVYSVIDVFFILLYALGAKSQIMLGMILLGVGLVGLLIALYFSFKKTVVIDQQGVRVIRNKRIECSIPWEACKEVGLYRYYYGRMLMVYFSRTAFTKQQILYRRPKGVILLNYSEDVLQQVKLCAPHKIILNGHLLPKDK